MEIKNEMINSSFHPSMELKHSFYPEIIRVCHHVNLNVIILSHNYFVTSSLIRREINWLMDIILLDNYSFMAHLGAMD